MHLRIKKKERNNITEALDIWQDVSINGTHMQRIEASIECAKLLEHQFKDITSALDYTEKAFRELDQLKIRINLKWIGTLEKRLERLKRKQSR